MKFWGRRRIVCAQAVRLMAGYLDDSLPRADRARLETHLAGCPHCTEHLAQLRVTIAAAGRVTDELSDAAVDDLIAVFRSWQGDEKGSPGV